eukprot:12404105-Karenia_brevis.AAC.1
MAFGLYNAVLLFNRVPLHIVAVARRWLAIPVISFFGDFKITDVANAKGSGWYYFLELCKLLGWVLDPEKAQPMSKQIKFLGIREDISELQS